MIAHRNSKYCRVSRSRCSWNQKSKSSTCGINSSSSKWSKWNIQLRSSNDVLICGRWDCSLRERIHKAKRRYFVRVSKCLRDSTSNDRSCYRNLVNSYICWAWRCAIKSWSITCTIQFEEMRWNTSAINFVSETPRTTILTTLYIPILSLLYSWVFNVMDDIWLIRGYYLFINAVSYDNIKWGRPCVTRSESHGLSDFISSCISYRISENLKWGSAWRDNLRWQRCLI